MSGPTVEAGTTIAHWIHAPTDCWIEPGAPDPMFEKPQNAKIALGTKGSESSVPAWPPGAS
jgi:hypothetical protein